MARPWPGQPDGRAHRLQPGPGAPGAVTGWAAYPAGVAWALRDAGYQVPGVTIDIESDLPVGAGLSSSAGLECATALALTGLAGLAVSRRELAEIARRAENDFIGVPSGIMDQSASLLCAAHWSLRDDFEVSWPHADVAVDAAVAAGALGARMVGGGFGGSVLALVPAGGAAAVRAAAADAFARHGWAAPEFIAAVPSGGAGRADSGHDR